MNTIVFDVKPIAKLTDRDFAALCQANPELKLEQTPTGEIEIVAPTGGETGIYNAGLIARFWIWNDQKKLGQVFDSSTCFNLPNGGKRSPDVSWISQTRWVELSSEQRTKFPPIAPDFVLELMSPTDRLVDVQAKMGEYMAAGVRLGWLLDRQNKRATIYRINQAVQILEVPDFLLGEAVLTDFKLDLQSLWA
jgi:Uma2 family endonuclease